MTDENKENKELKIVIDSLDELEKIAKSADRIKDPRTETSEKGDKEIREYVHKIAKEHVPGYSVKDAKELDPHYVLEKTGDSNKAKAAGEFLDNQLKFAQQLASTRAADTFSKNLDDILNALPQKGLEKLARTKQIVENAEGDEGEILKKYAGYVEVMDSMKRYEKGEEVQDDNEKKLRLTAMAKGAAETTRKELKKKGYNESLQELGSDLASLAVQAGHISEERGKEYTLAGYKELVKTTKKSYEETGKPTKAINSVIKRMAKEGDSKAFSTAMNLIAHAYKEAA